MKEKIAKWYKLGLWTEIMVKNASIKGIITNKEMVEILSN